MTQTFLVTGGAGFIGSNFVKFLLERRPEARVVNLDKMTYAGNADNLRDLPDESRHTFVRGDIGNRKLVESLFDEHGFDYVINFAAETHVDRSIIHAGSFIRTDIMGAHVLLETARSKGIKRFIQISTDEVYGSCQTGSFNEESTLNPRNPYSASKAGADRLAYSFWATYGVPVIITRASNNYGPFQHPEKLIPLFVTNALDNRPLPLYGDGGNVRDWLFVEDHCAAVEFLVDHGQPGEVYNVAGGNERTNLEITELILEVLNKPQSLIEFVNDRPGHDRRYSLDAARLIALGWRPQADFDSHMRATVKWYDENRWWWEKIKSRAAFKKYYRGKYGR